MFRPVNSCVNMSAAIEETQMNLDNHLSMPDIKHWVIIDSFTGQEKILPEVQLVEAFGKERWHKITSGLDNYFTAYEYNFEYTERGFKL